MGQDEAAVSNGMSGLSLHTEPQDELALQRLLQEEEERLTPPPPKITSEGVLSIDITERFTAAVRTLEPGQLVRDSYFTLFESVGALEIMDPKMDSGCLAEGDLLDEDYDVSRPLLPAEVIGIIDQLLCLEMAWHLGYPLSQTLLANVYIDSILTPNPTNIADADFIRKDSKAAASPMHIVLRAYCLGLLKACWFVVERIKFEHYYEEEDFVTNTFHRNLLDSIDREEIRDVIQDARAMIHNLRHSWSAEVSLALDARLELRYAFLRAIELTDLRTHPEPIKTPWAQMKAIMENVNKTHALGMPVPESFSVKLQRRLASTMPPRPIVQLRFEDAYPHWMRLFEDGAEVNDILKYTDSQTMLNFVITFQAKKPQPLVYIRTLLQSYIFKDNVLLGSLSIRQVMDDDFATVVLPCSLLLDPTNDDVEAVHNPRFAMAHQMEIFRQRSAQSYLDIFRAFCQNRCRIRRTLCHSIQEWENVQIDAEEIDQLLQVQLDERPLSYGSGGSGGGPSGGGGNGNGSSGNGSTTAANSAYSLPLSSWAYLYKLRQMEWIVQLGFELEIYQPDELAGMYWYLSYLAKRRAQHVERIKAFTVRSLNDQRGRPQSFTAAKEATFTRSLSYLRTTMLDAAVTWELADALSCLYTVLHHRLGLVPTPPRPYSSDELRYEVRMKPFAPIRLPEQPTFEQFSRATEQPENATAEVLGYAQRSVAGAKKGYEVLAKFARGEAFTGFLHERWVGATRDCLKSAIAAGIAVSTVQKALERAGGDEEVAKRRLKVEVPPPGKGYHDWWIIPKVTEIRD